MQFLAQFLTDQGKLTFVGWVGVVAGSSTATIFTNDLFLSSVHWCDSGLCLFLTYIVSGRWIILR